MTLRVLSFVAGVVAIAAGLYASLWVMIIGGSAAIGVDPDAIDGDPCCPTPDDLGQVVAWGGPASLLAGVVVAVLSVGVTLILQAVTRRRPRWREVGVHGAAGAAFVALAIAVAQLVQA